MSEAALKIYSETGTELFNSKTYRLFTQVDITNVYLTARNFGANIVRTFNPIIVAGRTFVCVKLNMEAAPNFNGMYSATTASNFICETDGYVDIIVYFRSAPPSGGAFTPLLCTLYRF